MMPNVVRGGQMVGLMSYLVGPGRSNEHTAPMVVGGDDRVLIEFEPGQELTHEDGQRIGTILDAPRRVHGTEVKAPVYGWDENTQRKVKVAEKDGHVWHCSLSLAMGDREVSKDEWGTIAREFVERMGFIDPDGARSSRWVAIHHGTSTAGNDHIHLAVQLVREDGTKANIHHDYRRAQRICGELEKEHGLAVLESRQVARGLSGDKPSVTPPTDTTTRGTTMESTITNKLTELLSQAPDTEVFADLHLHREPLTVTVELQD